MSYWMNIGTHSSVSKYIFVFVEALNVGLINPYIDLWS